MIDLSPITHCPICETKLEWVDGIKQCRSVFYFGSNSNDIPDRCSHFTVHNDLINLRTSDNDDPSFHYSIDDGIENFNYFMPNREYVSVDKTFSSLEEFVEYSQSLVTSFLFL